MELAHLESISAQCKASMNYACLDQPGVQVFTTTITQACVDFKMQTSML